MLDLTSIPICIIAGTLLGFLTGLGIGGGSLLMVWLTAVIGMPQEDARAINLLFFLPSSLIACIFRWKQGNLPFKKVLPAIIAGTAAAAGASWVGAFLDTQVLRKPFALILLAAGIKELCYRPRKAR